MGERSWQMKKAWLMVKRGRKKRKAKRRRGSKGITFLVPDFSQRGVTEQAVDAKIGRIVTVRPKYKRKRRGGRGRESKRK